MSVVLVRYDNGVINITIVLRKVDAENRHEAVGNVIETELKENPEHCYIAWSLSPIHN